MRRVAARATGSFLGAVLLGSLVLTGAAAAAEDDLPERYHDWLESVELLLTEAEREAFLDITADYQRKLFIERFWKVRDPFPQTVHNEFRERWEERVEKARELFDGLDGERARMLLTFGEPSRRRALSCPEILQHLDVWIYDEGSDQVLGYFTLIFVGSSRLGRGGRLWYPIEGLSGILQPGQGIGVDTGELIRRVRRDCVNADEILSHLAQSLDLSRVGQQTDLLPKPNDEWVLGFQARSTDLPEGAERLPGKLQVSFPGRHQSRTVVQGLILVPRAAAEITELGEHRAYHLVVDGEILRRDELFDRFRYRFAFPADDAAAPEFLPLVVQRYLRPGAYRLILKAEDQASGRAWRDERDLEVPRFEIAASPGGAAVSDTGATPTPAPSTVPPSEPGEPLARVDTLLGEANASISTGDHVVKILALPDILTVGKLRVEARVQGEGIARVAFELDGRPVMRKSRPPYSVELNLGDAPRVHNLRVVALDDEGRQLAADEVLVNAGPHRFAVRLIEPQRGRRYRSSVRAHAEVDVPEGERLDRVEFYLNETLLATLYQPPFEQPMLLPDDEDVTYVRAVAYLRGGSSTEDVTFINAPDYIDQVNVDFVELFTTVTNRKGDFVEGLTADDFTILEDGVEQQIRRFETVRDLPIRAGIVIDTSLSMMEELREVERAAYRFLETVITSRDRAAIFTFNDAPQLMVRFTNDKGVLAGGLAGLTAEGETALYDSIIFALHYFSGLKGKRSIVVLTDGEDSRSSYRYEDAVDFARRTGVAIYIVGLNLRSSEREARTKMEQLARETGGDVFYIDRAAQLGHVYEAIQQELRSQYLITYQSTQADKDREAFRTVEVEMRVKGLRAKTMRGYFP